MEDPLWGAKVTWGCPPPSCSLPADTERPRLPPPHSVGFCPGAKLEEDPWAHRLYLEFMGDAADAPVAAALAAIADAVRDLTLVASYPAASLLP